MKSVYPEAVQAVKNWIAKEELGAGSMLPAARVLAEKLGFTPPTMELASHVLVSSGFLNRKGYKLFVGAENPTRSPIEGEICVASYPNAGFNLAVGRILQERGVKHRAVEINFTKHLSPAHVLQTILAERPAGVILWMPWWFEELAPLIRKEKTPFVVCTDAAPTGLPFSTVGVDLYRGTEIALRHLFDLGHRQIAFVSGYKSSPLSLELAASFQKVCRQFRISSTAIWYTEQWGGLQETLLEQRKRCPEVTAIFAYVTVPSLVVKTFKVPQELSIVSLFDPGPESRSVMTAVMLRHGDQCVASWACAEIMTRIQAVELGRPAPPGRHALFVPELIVRKSTAPRAERPPSKGKVSKNTEYPASNIEHQRDAGAAGSDLEVGSSRLDVSPWESWSKTYAYLKKSRSQNWRQLDLSKLANHSMAREHGWLGRDPLLHFSPGLRSIHGVPFQVIEGNRNGGHAVVTFRSPHTHSTEGKELPVRVKLPVGGPVKALYFLHGCGYAHHAQPTAFAEYIVHFKKGGDARIPLIPIGHSMQMAPPQPCKLKPNLQDWWPGYRCRDFPHAKYVTIFNPADPQEYKRNLYTLEWINPRPKDAISHIEVRVGPKAGPTLALVSVTALVQAQPEKIMAPGVAF